MYLKRSAEFSIEFVTSKATLVFCLEATSASFPTLDRSFGIIGDITSRAVTGVANTARLTGVPLSDHSVTIIFSISTLGVGVTLGVGHQLIL
jgi:hypothetical protein